MTGTITPDIDSIPYQSTILDSKGTIVSVNKAWRTFAEQNGAPAALRAGIGINYLDVCRTARGINSDEAGVALRSLERVLEGVASYAAFQYPCNSPSEQRWFICATSPSCYRGGSILVAHIRLGEQRAVRNMRGELGYLAERITSRHLLLEDNKKRQRELAIHEHVQEMTAAGGWDWNLSDGELHWTTGTFQIYDVVPDMFIPTIESMLAFYNKAGRDQLTFAFLQAEHFGVPFDLELPMVSATKRRIQVRMTGRAEINGIKPMRLFGAIQDITVQHVLKRQIAKPKGRPERH